jgi:hypothetical protein
LVRLDTRTGRVTVNGNPVKLTSHEYRLLAYLMHHSGRVVSRTELPSPSTIRTSIAIPIRLKFLSVVSGKSSELISSRPSAGSVIFSFRKMRGSSLRLLFYATLSWARASLRAATPCLTSFMFLQFLACIRGFARRPDIGWPASSPGSTAADAGGGSRAARCRGTYSASMIRPGSGATLPLFREGVTGGDIGRECRPTGLTRHFY